MIKEYECPNCGKFEVIHSNPENLNDRCCWCGEKVNSIYIIHSTRKGDTNDTKDSE